MNKNILFEDKDRDYYGFASHLENIFDFYDRSARKEMGRIRDKLNEWFSRYPANERIDLKKRFKSTFSSAFFELFLHELFLNIGFDLTPHPELAHTSKRPDFLAKKNELKLFIEAREASDMSDNEKAKTNLIDTLYGTLDQIETDYFFQIDHLNIKSHRQPGGRKIKKYIEEQLKRLNPEELFERVNLNGFNDLESIVYNDDNVYLKLSLIPKSSKDKDYGSNIGIYPYVIYNGGTDVTIKNALSKKATKYGKLDQPFIICINSTSFKGTDEHDVLNALFGPLKLEFSNNPVNRNARWISDGGGFFISSKGNPQNTRVSGVFVSNVNEGNLHRANHWLVKHPYATNDFDFSSLELGYSYLEGSKLRNKEGKNIKDILKIPEDWLDTK